MSSVTNSAAAKQLKSAVSQALQTAADGKKTEEKTAAYVPYTGGNTELDKAIEPYSQKYAQARERALAGDRDAVREMQDANDSANQLRNQYGYEAQHADKDIAYVWSQVGGSSSGKKTSSGGGGVSGGGVQKASASAAKVATVSPIKSTAVKPQPVTVEVNDYSDYLTAMEKARREAAVEQLKAAYEKNVAQMDKDRAQVAPKYEAARNRAAGQSALSGQRLNEYAAAHGLGSGAGGQARLSLENQLQTTLGDLSAREADALAELDLERTRLDIDYNAAIAKAQSEGDYQLAQQLYNEKIRRDEALTAAAKWQAQQEQWAAEWQDRQDQWQSELRFKQDQWLGQQSQWQAEQDYKNSYFDWQKEQAAQSAARQEALAEAKAGGESEEKLREMLLQYAAGTGDYSALAAYYTPEQIAKLEKQWQEKETQAAGSREAAEAKSQRELADWAAKYGDYEGLKALGLDTGYLEQTQAAQLAQLQSKASQTVGGKATSAAYKPNLTVSQVDKAIDNGRITDQVKRDFAYYYGVDYDVFFSTGEGADAPAPAPASIPEDGSGEGILTDDQFTTALNTLKRFLAQGEWDLAMKGAKNLKAQANSRQRELLAKALEGYGSAVR